MILSLRSLTARRGTEKGGRGESAPGFLLQGGNPAEQARGRLAVGGGGEGAVLHSCSVVKHWEGGSPTGDGSRKGRRLLGLNPVHLSNSQDTFSLCWFPGTSKVFVKGRLTSTSNLC